MKKKFIILAIIVAVLGVLSAVIFLLDFSKSEIKYGVTFSKQYASEELLLDWKETYLAILDDLKVDHIRLSAYWNETEPLPGVYKFDDLDWQISEASKRNVNIILAVGRRLPRWPECHDPIWLKNQNDETIQERQLKFVKKVIERYDSNSNIYYWQIENEPYLKYFGICPPLDKEFFKEEILLAKELTDKPILVTDSGELSIWFPVAKSGGDVLGTTLYKVVYNNIFGYFEWFLPPFYYFGKAYLVKSFTPIEKVIVAELQAEAWHKGDKSLSQLTLNEAFESVDLNQFKKNVSFSRRAGFDEIYLWGAEWWYMLKKDKGYDAFWEEAKKLW